MNTRVFKFTSTSDMRIFSMLWLWYLNRFISLNNKISQEQSFMHRSDSKQEMWDISGGVSYLKKGKLRIRHWQKWMLPEASASLCFRVAGNSGSHREASKVLSGEWNRVPLLVWTKVAAPQGKLHANNARGPGNRSRAGKILVQN
jgi:hypothetical protein